MFFLAQVQNLKLKCDLLNFLILIATLSLSLTHAQAKDLSVKKSNAGRFAQGKTQLSFGGGSSSLGLSNYLIVQGRFGYFLIDGLSFDLGAQAWFPFDDKGQSVYVFSPGATAYLYQLKSFVPYVGAFYQHAISQIQLEGASAIGGRAGVLISQGRGHLGLGVRVTQGLECGADCRIMMPELSFFIGF